MLDALSSAAPAGLAAVNQALIAAAAQAATPPATVTHIKVDAPAGISPAISFNRETDEVIFTYRSAETGKVTEQIPPAEATLRYLAVSDSGEAASPPPSRPSSVSGSQPSSPSSTTGAQAAPTPPAPTGAAAITPGGNPTPSSSNTVA